MERTTKETSVARRDRPRRHRPGRRRRPASASTTTCSTSSAGTASSTSRSRPRATCTSTRHHTIEDTALALGAAFKQALGDKVGIYRFGNCTVPLDESLAQVTVDLSGRPYLVHTEPESMAPMIGAYDTTMTRHILESFVAQAQIALHVHVPYGRNAHHIVECQFKALARALRYASELDPRAAGIPPPRRARCDTASTPILIVVGLFLLGGVYLLLEAEAAQGRRRAARDRLRAVRCSPGSCGWRVWD